MCPLPSNGKLMFAFLFVTFCLTQTHTRTQLSPPHPFSFLSFLNPSHLPPLQVPAYMPMLHYLAALGSISILYVCLYNFKASTRALNWHWELTSMTSFFALTNTVAWKASG